MPHLQKLYDHYRDKGMKMVAINIMPEENDQVAAWKQEKGFTFEVLTGDDQAALMNPYAVLATPTTFLIDADARLLLRIDGVPPDSLQSLEAVIRRQLGLALPLPVASH